jgi:two-component system, response regulator PdtaR
MGPTILVVEDERITAEDIKSGLESEGYQVLDMVSSGKAAIKRAGELRPDLILMDIKLKGKMDGIEAAGQIKSLYDIPVIYVTAYSDEYTVEQAKITDSSGHIIKEDSDLVKKPFEEEDLHNIIENTLYRHKMEKDHDILLLAMLKNINEAVIATNAEYKVILMNSAAENFAGWKLDDAIGKDLSEVFTPFNGIKKPYTYNDINKFISNNDIYLKSNQNDNVLVKCDFNVIRADSKHINGYILVFNNLIDK